MEYYKNKDLIDLPNEIWVDAYGYDGIYEVSNLGRIKSLERYVPNGRGSQRIVKEIILSQSLSKKDGRLSLRFSVNNIMKTQNVSALIFQSFNISKTYNVKNECIMHIDKDKSNNVLSNLKIELISKSHTLNYKKGLLPHLDINHKNITGLHFRLSHKSCTKCGEEKTIDNFDKNRRVCKCCRKLQKNLNYRRNLARVDG